MAQESVGVCGSRLASDFVGRTAVDAKDIAAVCWPGYRELPSFDDAPSLGHGEHRSFSATE